MTSPESKLYVGCGLTNAPEPFKEKVSELKNVLRKKYEVFDFLGTVAGTPEDVYRWDIEHCVANCDLFIGVCDYDSIGLGRELGEAVHLNKPILTVAHADSRVTRMVLGEALVKPHYSFRTYGYLVLDVPEFIEEKLLEVNDHIAAKGTLGQS